MAELLDTLEQHGWYVVHDIRIGSYWVNIDHLVIGPPGGFVININFLGRRVWVAGSNVRVCGYRENFVKAMEREAKSVREKLVGATCRRSLWALGVVVFVDSSLTVKEQPANVMILHAPGLVSWLQSQAPRMEPAEMRELFPGARGARGSNKAGPR